MTKTSERAGQAIASARRIVRLREAFVQDPDAVAECAATVPGPDNIRLTRRVRHSRGGARFRPPVLGRRCPPPPRPRGAREPVFAYGLPAAKGKEGGGRPLLARLRPHIRLRRRPARPVGGRSPGLASSSGWPWAPSARTSTPRVFRCHGSAVTRNDEQRSQGMRSTVVSATGRVR